MKKELERNEIIKHIYNQMGLSWIESTAVVQAFFDCIAELVLDETTDGDLIIRKFGHFYRRRFKPTVRIHNNTQRIMAQKGCLNLAFRPQRLYNIYLNTLPEIQKVTRWRLTKKKRVKQIISPEHREKVLKNFKLIK